jgi:hypothetical protein
MTGVALTDIERDEVARLAALLDHAASPVPASLLPPERRLQQALIDMLARRGRVLVEVDRGEQLMWTTSAVADPVADELAAAGLGLLTPHERAALALVLLRCVVLPTANGQQPVSWVDAERVPTATVISAALSIPDQHVRSGLRSLSLRGLVDAAPAGVKPGPALERLTARARQRLERDLVTVVAGTNPLIRRVLDRLAATDPRPTGLSA